MKFLFLFFMFMTSYIFAEETSVVEPSPYTLKVSDGNFNNKVDLVWDTVPGVEYYTVERVYNAPKNTKLGKEIPLETNMLVQAGYQTHYTDNSIPFGQHLYVVTAYKTNITEKIETKRERKKREKKSKKTKILIPIPIVTNVLALINMTDFGHRKITDQEFFLEFQKTIDSSLPRIRTMKMLNFFGEKKSGWNKGRLIYKTTGIFRKPFRVTIKYEDFIDQSLSLNGTYEVQIFKLFAQKGKLVGTFNIDGIYKGTVTHNLIIDRGQSIGGTYDVQQEGRKMVSLPWNVTTHPLDDTQYEEALKNSVKEAEVKEETAETNKTAEVEKIEKEETVETAKVEKIVKEETAEADKTAKVKKIVKEETAETDKTAKVKKIVKEETAEADKTAKVKKIEEE